MGHICGFRLEWWWTVGGYGAFDCRKTWWEIGNWQCKTGRRWCDW